MGCSRVHLPTRGGHLSHSRAPQRATLHAHRCNYAPRNAPRAALVFLLLLACASPESISIEEERAMGTQVARQAATQLPLVRDPAITRFVSELGQILVYNADTTGREYTFYVVDSPAANAFAIPGGFIFINRGILELADNVAEVAGVMAHEIGHVVARHSLEQMAKAQNANAAVSLVYVLLNRTPGIGEQVALQVAGSAWLAKHSREAEREADEVGIIVMTRARIDPRGMTSFFEKLLEEEQRRPGMVLQWFSTHPLTRERIADTRALIAQLPPEALARARRDVPQFAKLKARVAALPPPPPDPTTSAGIP